jgi:hypothetical protein
VGKNVARCNVCRAESVDVLCPRCTRELRELLVGIAGKPHKSLLGQEPQPGIVWYIERLTEHAFRQSRLANRISRRGNAGYYLLADARASDLLSRIRVTLQDWAGAVWALIAPLRQDQQASVGRDRADRIAGLESVALARWLAYQIPHVRKHPDVAVLHATLLAYAKEAWRIINRPADVCCGQCQQDDCDTMLYAEENSATVRCPRCRTRYDVSVLRQELRSKVKDKLFTGSELRKLMETRLNDRIPDSSFRALVRSKRLKPRGVNADGAELFTYDDVVKARDERDEQRRKTK